MKISAAALVSLLLSASPLVAQQVFVSSTGSDSNNCFTFTTPCRTFAGALSQVSAGGEVIAIGSGEFGIATINKAVTIEAAPGVFASIEALSGLALSISAGASDKVILRNLVFEGASSNGVAFSQGRSLEIENCVFNGFSAGILHQAASSTLTLRHSTIRNSATSGLSVAVPSGTTTVTVSDCAFEQNATAISTSKNAAVSVTDSTFTSNTIAISAQPFTSGSLVEMSVTRCLLNGNVLVGVQSAPSSGANATVRISDSTVTNSGTGLRQVGVGVIESLGNNVVRGNSTDKFGTVTVVLPD
ncbi:MAG TPA: right-handed parallel beta-helix repeat-containing protein [Thermoanaerobaculia bacterium]|nr:right-handed parallel beta-helix repeat-containing protein [Thermoanaerobaculia bacterium]